VQITGASGAKPPGLTRARTVRLFSCTVRVQGRASRGCARWVWQALSQGRGHADWSALGIAEREGGPRTASPARERDGRRRREADHRAGRSLQLRARHAPGPLPGFGLVPDRGRLLPGQRPAYLELSRARGAEPEGSQSSPLDTPQFQLLPSTELFSAIVGEHAACEECGATGQTCTSGRCCGNGICRDCNLSAHCGPSCLVGLCHFRRCVLCHPATSLDESSSGRSDSPASTLRAREVRNRFGNAAGRAATAPPDQRQARHPAVPSSLSTACATSTESAFHPR
jgi:hypothetical protein